MTLFLHYDSIAPFAIFKNQSFHERLICFAAPVKAKCVVCLQECVVSVFGLLVSSIYIFSKSHTHTKTMLKYN